MRADCGSTADPRFLFYHAGYVSPAIGCHTRGMSRVKAPVVLSSSTYPTAASMDDARVLPAEDVTKDGITAALIQLLGR